jgi:hypothetical protein
MEFRNNQEANIILDSLILGNFNILDLNKHPKNEIFISIKEYALTTGY